MGAREPLSADQIIAKAAASIRLAFDHGQRVTMDDLDNIPPMDGYELSEPPAKAHGASLTSGADFLASIVTPDYAVYPIVQRSHVVAITAHTGHGKSTLAYAMACWIARGLTVGPFECKKGRVLLLIGENPPNAALQLRAAVARYGLSDDDLRSRLVVRSGSAFMSDVGGAIARELKGGDEFVAVIVDTSSAFFSYEDEIDNVQARRHAVDLRTLTELPGGPAVLVMCHPTKSAAQDALLPRGGGAFLNEIDANLTLWNDGDKCSLSYTKLRGTPFSPIGVRFEPQEVGAVDHKGRPMVPMVAVVLDEMQEAAIAHARTFDEDSLLRSMLANKRASIRALATKCGWADNTAKVHRMLKDFEKEKPALVRSFRGSYELTGAGEKEAGACG